MSKIYSVPNFEYGYIRKEEDMVGIMAYKSSSTLTIPFRPHWWVQYLGNGQSAIFDTKKECLQWIKKWNDNFYF